MAQRSQRKASDDTKTNDPTLALCASLVVAGMNDMGDTEAAEIAKWLVTIARTVRSKKREQYSNKTTFRYYKRLPTKKGEQCHQEHKPL